MALLGALEVALFTVSPVALAESAFPLLRYAFSRRY